jgi:hypothetical protein
MAAADKAVAVVLDFGTITRQGETTNAVAVNGPALLLKHSAATTTTTTTTVISSRDDDRTGPELLCPDRMVKIIQLVVYVSSPVVVALTAICCSRIQVAEIPNAFHVRDVAKHKTRIFRITPGDRIGQCISGYL